MGSPLIFNDTLNLTVEQGFPSTLDLNQHFKTPYKTEDFAGQTFTFHKPSLRFYHPQPIRVYLVENIDGKWVYWGMTHVLRASLDYVEKTTSGEYKIVDIFSSDYMQYAFETRDARANFDYLATL